MARGDGAFSWSLASRPATGVDEYDQQSTASLTPTASQTQLDRHAAQSSVTSSDRDSVPPPPYSNRSSLAKDTTTIRTSTLTSASLSSVHKHDTDTDAVSAHAPSTFAPSLFASTLNSYAPSSAVEQTSLLPHGYTRERRASAMPFVQKTKARKAFEGVCDAVNIVIPLDKNDGATSMSESSLGRLAKAIHHDRKRSIT